MTTHNTDALSLTLFSQPAAGSAGEQQEDWLPTEGKSTSPAPTPRRQESSLRTWDFKCPFRPRRGKPVCAAQIPHWCRLSCPAAREVTCPSPPPPARSCPSRGQPQVKTGAILYNKGLAISAQVGPTLQGPSSSHMPCGAGETVPGLHHSVTPSPCPLLLRPPLSWVWTLRARHEHPTAMLCSEPTPWSPAHDAPLSCTHSP